MRKRRRHLRPAPRSVSGAAAIARLLMVVAVLLIAVVLVDLRIRPTVEDMIAYQAKLYAMRTINGAVLEELEGEDVDYGDLAHLTRAADGKVMSIQMDTVAINRLKARTADAVIKELEDMGSRIVRVPVGTLLGNQFTSGLGPEVEIRVIPAGYVQSEMINEFRSAGINQTMHQVMLQTSVQMTAILPGYSVRTEATTGFVIAETVIVGAIPDGYTIVNGDDSSTISKINDYRAGR